MVSVSPQALLTPLCSQQNRGDWVLLLSTTPAEQRLRQKIYVATSTDGLTWDIRDDPLLEDSNRNYPDPSAGDIPRGMVRRPQHNR